MRKVRQCLWAVVIYFIQNPVAAQTATSVRHKFSTPAEAADTLFARLLHRKLQNLEKFLLPENAFITETRKHDTIIPNQMIHGQYLNYTYKVERSFRKTWKKMRKLRISERRAVKDTILVYQNSSTSNLKRVEVYFFQRKYSGYIKFQLWQVEEYWYFNNKIELVLEKK